MTLALYGHRFSSYTQKVLIALHENAIAFDFRALGPDAPEHAAEWLRRWPFAKFPILVDGDRTVAETSVIVEHLQLHRPGPVRLIPDDPRAALDVRFLDRVFDQHVMTPVQSAVAGALSGDADRARAERTAADGKLEVAYGWLETALAGRTWAAGDAFTLADCAAAPALFYADWVRPIPEAHAGLRAYRARLLARPSFARCVEAARPDRHLFPLGAPDRD